MIEFGRGALEFEVLGREHDIVAFFESDLASKAVGVACLAGLGGFEVFGDVMVDLGEVLGVGHSGGVGNRGFDRRSGWDARMEAIVGKERCGLGRGLFCIVDCEGGEGEKVDPVVLLVCAVSAKYLFESPVGSLRLSIGLRVVGCRHLEFGSAKAGELAPEVGGEARVAV